MLNLKVPTEVSVKIVLMNLIMHEYYIESLININL